MEEIEVEEKPKTYVSKYRRFRKDEIGKLDQWGIMVLLENDPKTYLLALKKEREKRAELLQKELEKMKEQIRELMMN